MSEYSTISIVILLVGSLQPHLRVAAKGLWVEVQQDGRDQDVGARRQRAQVGQEGGVDRDDATGGQADRLGAGGRTLVVGQLARHGLERGSRHRVVAPDHEPDRLAAAGGGTRRSRSLGRAESRPPTAWQPAPWRTGLTCPPSFA